MTASDGAAICGYCARVPETRFCIDCGKLDVNIDAQRCAGCSVKHRIALLREQSDPGALARLEPFLAALERSKNPRSQVAWINDRRSGWCTVVGLARGEIVLSHEGLDALDRGQSTRYLRGALVAHGALPERDEDLVAFERWAAQQLATVADSGDARHLRSYATWRLGRALAADGARGTRPRSAPKLARSRLSEAIKFTRWLHRRDLALADVDQSLVDAYLAAGTSTQRRIRHLLAWLQRQRVLGRLDAPPFVSPLSPRPPSDRKRLALLARLLGDEELDLRDRIAGTLVLLYAQPITRIATLTTSAIVDLEDGTLAIALGAERFTIAPPPLDELLRRIRTSPPPTVTAAAAISHDWLFPGLIAGRPLSAEQLRRRLKRLGITVREQRAGALLQLVRQIPAPVLASMLGLSPSTAARWAQLAGTDQQHVPPAVPAGGGYRSL